MNNRDSLKWAPFNAVINSKEVIKEINQEKMRIKKPVLSDDEIDNIEKSILDNYYSQNEVIIKYYKNNQITKINGIITKIDSPNKKITLNNNIYLYFSNIIGIFEKNT